MKKQNGGIASGTTGDKKRLPKRERLPQVGKVTKRKCIYVQLELPFPLPSPEERRSTVRGIIERWTVGSRKSCSNACSPSDYYPGGKCGLSGCVEARPTGFIEGATFQGGY